MPQSVCVRYRGNSSTIGTVLSLDCHQSRLNLVPKVAGVLSAQYGGAQSRPEKCCPCIFHDPPVYGMIGNSNTGTGNSGKSVFTIDCARGTASAGRVADVRPIDPYIAKKRRSSRFQRGIAHRQQTSFTVTVMPGVHRNGWPNSTFTHIPVLYQY